MLHDLDLHGVARMHHKASPKPNNPRKNIQSKLPVIKKDEQKIVAVLAVFPGKQGVCFSAKNRFKVDWGDGSVQNSQSGCIATHVYNYEQLGPETLNPNGYKEVIIIIEPQKRYSLTEINFDPILERQAIGEGLEAISMFEVDRADWLSIEISSSNLTSIVLAQDKVKTRHPRLEHYSVSN